MKDFTYLKHFHPSNDPITTKRGDNSQLSLRSIGGPGDLKLCSLDLVGINLTEDEKFADRHLVGGQGLSLIHI